MKKTILIILAPIIILFANFNPVFAITAEELVPQPSETDITEYPDTGYVKNLPKVDEFSFITSVIKTILGWSMILVLSALVIASINYLLARGQEEKITKAKQIIIYLLVGMAIMAAAYGIIAGFTQFEFFA